MGLNEAIIETALQLSFLFHPILILSLAKAVMPRTLFFFLKYTISDFIMFTGLRIHHHIQFQSIFYQPKKVLPPLSNHLPVAFLILGLKLPLIYLSVPMEHCIFDISCKWNDTTFILLCLTFHFCIFFSRFIYVVTCLNLIPF